MKGLFVICAVISLGSAVIDQKWHKSDDGTAYYIDSAEKYNWFEAWNECARMDMSLLVVESLYKHQQIDKLLRRLYTVCPSIWLAAHENAVDTKYEWATNGRPLTFTNWAVGEPNGNKGNEHCLLIWKTKWDWYDISCWAKSGFICEENQLLKAKNEELDKYRRGLNITVIC